MLWRAIVMSSALVTQPLPDPVKNILTSHEIDTKPGNTLKPTQLIVLKGGCG